MDLPLWDTLIDQGYSDGWLYDYSGYEPASQWSYYSKDDGCGDFSFGYKPDTIEEDALNEKCCVQVLRILISKADEEIVKLEEDILMLQCQLAWDDEKWSQPCSFALKERIDHLDVSVQRLKKGITKDVHDFGVELEEPRTGPLLIHALVKPLLEKYFLVKSKQKENTTIQISALPTIQISALPAVRRGERKIVANTSKFIEEETLRCIHLKKNNERKSPSIDHKERKTNTIQSESSNAMVKDLSARTSIEKGGSTGRGAKRNTDVETTSKEKVTRSRLERECKVAISYLELQETEMKIAERVKVCRRLINKSSDSSKPLVRKRKKTNFHERTEPLEIQETEIKDTDSDTLLELFFNRRRRYAGQPKKKTEPQFHVQQTQEMETDVINQDNSNYFLKPEPQGPESACELAPEIAHTLCMAEKIELISSSLEVPGNINRKRKRDDASEEVTIASFFSTKKKRKISLSSPTKRETKGLKKTLMKSAKYDCSTSNFTAEVKDECGVEGVSNHSVQVTKGVKGLTMKDLRAIAKNRKLRNYSNLRKEELQKRLGLVS